MTAVLTHPRSFEKPAVAAIASVPPQPAEKPPRLVSLDAYRGFIMLVMASAGFGFPAVAKHFPDSPVWQLLGRGWNVHLTALVLILAGYTLLFGLYPLRGDEFNYRSVGVDDKWQHLTGWFGHWDKNTNVAADFDVWFLNLFPRPSAYPFAY